MFSQHCENVHWNWKTWQEFTMRSKFKGKYLEVEPLGITHLEFPKTGNHYTWRKVKTIVHNIVIGKVSHKPASLYINSLIVEAALLKLIVFPLLYWPTLLLQIFANI